MLRAGPGLIVTASKKQGRTTDLEENNTPLPWHAVNASLYAHNRNPCLIESGERGVLPSCLISTLVPLVSEPEMIESANPSGISACLAHQLEINLNGLLIKNYLFTS